MAEKKGQYNRKMNRNYDLLSICADTVLSVLQMLPIPTPGDRNYHVYYSHFT